MYILARVGAGVYKGLLGRGMQEGRFFLVKRGGGATKESAEA